MDNFLAFPVNQRSFQVLDLCYAATNACHFDSWNLSETQGNVLGNTRPMFETSQTPYRGILHSTTPSTTGEIPVRICTGAPVAGDEERIGSTIPMPTFASRPSTMNYAGGYSTEFHGWTAKTADIGASVRQIHLSIITYLLEDKIQKPSKFLFRFPSDALLWIKEVGWSIQWMN